VQGEKLFDDSDNEASAVPHTNNSVVAIRAASSAPKSAAKAAAPAALTTVKPFTASNDDDDDDDRGGGFAPLSAAKRHAAATSARRTADAMDLQVVPASTNDDGDSTDTDGEFEAMDDHAKAEIRAMARKWMKSRKNQLGLLDAAYNRYTFNDQGLPRWFKDDEAKHMRAMTGATREELAAEKELLRAIDARPLKKVRCLLSDVCYAVDQPRADGRQVVGQLYVVCCCQSFMQHTLPTSCNASAIVAHTEI
jgi:hypothetical protein